MMMCGKCRARAITENQGIQYCPYCSQGHYIEIFDDGSISIQHYPFEHKEDEGEPN